MKETVEVKMADFAAFARKITKERGVVSLRVIHRPECPCLQNTTQALEDAIARLRAGNLDLTAGHHVCDCQTVQVEIE